MCLVFSMLYLIKIPWLWENQSCLPRNTDTKFKIYVTVSAGVLGSKEKNIYHLPMAADLYTFLFILLIMPGRCDSLLLLVRKLRHYTVLCSGFKPAFVCCCIQNDNMYSRLHAFYHKASLFCWSTPFSKLKRLGDGVVVVDRAIAGMQ